MPDTAEDALVRFAVCGMQLYGRLAVESRLYFDAGIGDTAYDVVVFGRKLFEKPHGLVGLVLVTRAYGIGVKQRGYAIDDDQPYGSSSQRLGAGWRFDSESVVRIPISFQMNVEKRLNRFFIVAIEQAGEKVESPMYQLRQQGDTLVRKVGGAQTEELPTFTVDGREGEFISQEIVFPG